MRLLALLLTGILTAGPAFAQTGQPSPLPSSGDDGQTPPTSSAEQAQHTSELPVSLDKIREALEHPPAEPLRGLDERPTFRVQIRERQKIEELLSTLKFNSGPAVPGGLYGYEQQQSVFPKVDNPLMQPYSAFNQGQLITVLIENLLEQYLGARAIKGITDASRARAEEAAREEVQRAFAEFCATHVCTPP